MEHIDTSIIANLEGELCETRSAFAELSREIEAIRRQNQRPPSHLLALHRAVGMELAAISQGR